MEAELKQVLVVSPDIAHDAAVFRKVAPFLLRLECELHRVPNGVSAIALVEETRFDLVVVVEPVESPTLSELVQRMRSRRSASRQAALIVLAVPGLESAAEGLMSHGVNRVCAHDVDDERLAVTMRELFAVAPRIPLASLVRVSLFARGRMEEVITQTENISASGMLLRGRLSYPVGTFLAFELTPPGIKDPIRGTAEVVRHTTPEREPVHGFAARFAMFDVDGHERLCDFIEKQRAIMA
jgi:CheY-like chemotaxis protein